MANNSETSGLKLYLNLPALERLIGTDKDLEVSLKSQVSENYIKKHIKAKLEEAIEKIANPLIYPVAQKLVADVLGQNHNIPGMYSWNSHVEVIVAKALEEKLKPAIRQKIIDIVNQMVEEKVTENQTIDNYIQRKIELLLAGNIRERVDKEIDRRLKIASEIK